MATLTPKPFESPAVNAARDAVSARMADERLRLMFQRCLMNTLETTLVFTDGNDPDTYVITGDIDAMWLRDSSAQVWPYVQFATQDPRLACMLRGVIARQARQVMLDPYANAFCYDETGTTPNANDVTQMKRGVFERKFEVDSLAHVIRLSAGYLAATGDRTICTPDWWKAMHRIVETLTVEQNHPARSDYSFERLQTCELSTLYEGVGTPVAITGMPWSGFRPSDDRCEFHYNVPASALSVVALQRLAQVVASEDENDLAYRAARLAAEIQGGLHSHGRVRHPVYGEILAYEVDGIGSAALMDDANVPSLLSLPYLGWCESDNALYVSTRQFVLSRSNPYFAWGKLAEGVGSPHTEEGRVWPMSIIMRAMTSRDDHETLACLRMLRALAGEDGLMHESVDPDDAGQFSRPWFAWANSLFGELILHLAATRPALLEAKL